MGQPHHQPLHGITVLDFSTLLPGPMATLLLAEAGAEVIKIERPGNGDEMRSYTPKFGNDSVNFALLNRAKKSIAIDLKSVTERARLEELVRSADIIVEQFRPGVMQRLGLDYETVSRINPKIIYCSITGYGQSGPKAQIAAHDLNYVADSGMLALSTGADGAPVLPAALVADIAGGAYPAVMNILLALQARAQSGLGCHLDIAMADNLFTFMYWGLGNGFSAGEWPKRGKELVTGGSARYQVYRTSDNRYLAAAPLEDKFWTNFTEIIGIPQEELAADDQQAIARVAAAIAQHSADYWLEKFKGREVCVGLVADLEDAVADPHFIGRGLFTQTLDSGKGDSIPALPVPICNVFRQTQAAGAPELGQSNTALIGEL
ncbi:CaiB/BaiF CoA-transferase family protein [Glaciimonas sp. Gout2]|uniref:CaiB/BaiF CoA transferase family protein n=2 Tax=Glaciimonas TaxID=1229970 RepID=UPI002AB4EEA0|nr:MULTISPECIES: CaiB/BaiF CoA-transferase family protein [unclassified Glaciimonas]MDY7548420.1 CaiB/BaiF CoA-transferase family protein [Glaciimonas sp. CA11.2]MEB0010430.1 CaiB/BaiF CoA-transferase family protein [Glaciimonas sp. Cout2]MEB0083975.1 CaiB/BaiF CoA-transferase family protein [Glaciimonas sp. Gout2]